MAEQPIELVLPSIEELQDRIATIWRLAEGETKEQRVQDLEKELADPEVWNQADKVKEFNQEKSKLERALQIFKVLRAMLGECEDYRELLEMERDPETQLDFDKRREALLNRLQKAELTTMLSKPFDDANTFLTIQAGSGGTEAQDWADMLMRMYLRWCERREFKTEVQEISHGEVAGIKGCTILVEGDYAHGWSRTEAGIHRLVRHSPFDSGNRRHTSFASVFLSPEVNNAIEIDLDMKDVRVDTYRASGAGGQHVNKTDSAVRLTHLPSGLVAQCQNQRSQHQNKDSAMKQLMSKLYELEVNKQKEARQSQEAEKKDIGWGSQIRSYVLDQSRIKDVRTGHEVSNIKAVLDGDLDSFIEASLKQGVH